MIFVFDLKIIQILGEIDADMDFDTQNINVHSGCAATLNDEMYIFGGSHIFGTLRQVNF